MKLKRIFFVLLCITATMYTHAEVFVDSVAKFSIDIPEGWNMAKQNDMYIFYSGNDMMSMSIVRAEWRVCFSPNDTYQNLKKGDESMHNIKVHRGLWLTFFMHYVTRTYEQNGKQVNEYYRVFPKTAFLFNTYETENSEVKLAIARSVRLEPWNCWTQFKIMWSKLGWLMTLLFIAAWIAAGWFAAFLVPFIKQDTFIVTGILLIWLSFPLFWWGGEQIMYTLYGVGMVIFIATLIVERNDSHTPVDEIAVEYNYVSPNKDILRPIALVEYDESMSNYIGMKMVQEAYGYMYGNANVKKNKKKAFELLHTAATAGNLEAMVEVALMLRDGEGVRKNKKLSCEWMIQAAQKGSAQAIALLASYAFFGYGRFETSRQDTIWLLQKAQKLGNPLASKILQETTESVSRLTRDAARAMINIRQKVEQMSLKPELKEGLIAREEQRMPHETITRFKEMDNLNCYFMTEKERKRYMIVSRILDFVGDKFEDINGWF